MLRALWVLHACGVYGGDRYRSLLASSTEPEVRAWAIRLGLETSASAAFIDDLVKLSTRERDAQVRLALAAGLQRLPLEQRWLLAEAFLPHEADASDANIPHLLWYGTEPLAAADPARAAALAGKTRIPLVRRLLARRLTLLEAEGVGPLATLLKSASDAEVQRDVLSGMLEALQGRRDTPAPAGWAAIHRKLAASPSAEVREPLLALLVLFGDPQALAAIRSIAADTRAEAGTRARALQQLVDKRPADLFPLLRDLLADKAMRGAAPARACFLWGSADSGRCVETLCHLQRYGESGGHGSARQPSRLGLRAARRHGTRPDAASRPVFLHRSPDCQFPGQGAGRQTQPRLGHDP